jgi:plasmid stabilization system protein ParE
MAYQIVWTENAELDLQNLLDYWSVGGHMQTCYKFLDVLYEKLDTLAEMPTIGVASSEVLGVHRIILTHHQVLYYHINQINQIVTLLNVFDTRQNPDKNPF